MPPTWPFVPQQPSHRCVRIGIDVAEAVAQAECLENKSFRQQKSRPRKVMKQLIRIAVIESDPLRFVGLRTCLSSAPDLELSASSLSEVGARHDLDLALLGNHAGPDLFEAMATLKAARPGLRIIVMSSGMDEEKILKAIASGAKGYIDDAAAPAEFVQAIRAVDQGSVWAPRRILSLFIERSATPPDLFFPQVPWFFPARERKGRKILFPARSKKKIA